MQHGSYCGPTKPVLEHLQPQQCPVRPRSSECKPDHPPEGSRPCPQPPTHHRLAGLVPRPLPASADQHLPPTGPRHTHTPALPSCRPAPGGAGTHHYAPVTQQDLSTLPSGSFSYATGTPAKESERKLRKRETCTRSGSNTCSRHREITRGGTPAPGPSILLSSTR